jgi:hypothetical protein
LQGEESKKEELARMLCRHVQLQFQSLDWRNIAKHQTRHGKQKKPRSNTKKHYPQTMQKNRKNSRKKTQKKHEKNTKTEHEKNTKKTRNN